MANELANPLTYDPNAITYTGLESYFGTGNTINDPYAWTLMFGTDEDKERILYTDVPGVWNEEGSYWMNEDGERLYRWQASQELGEEHMYHDTGTMWATEAEMREAWDADQGMGYFKEAADMTFDEYLAYSAERDDYMNENDMGQGIDRQYLAEWVKDNGRYPTAEEMQSDTGFGYMPYTDMEWHQDLMDKYGIPRTWNNKDGDVFEFNGSTFTKTTKVDDHLRPGDYMKMAAIAAVGFAAAGPLSAALQGAGLSGAAAKAAAQGIIGLAKGYVQSGELNLQDALLAAATSYGGSQLSDALQGSGFLGEIGSKVTEIGDSLMNNGGDILNSALQAGGMSLVTQLVKDGEIDWKDAAVAALMGGGAAALTGYLQGIGKDDSVDEFEQWLDEQEGMDAEMDKLNQYIDLYDQNGDGLVNANDLEEVTVPDRELAPESYDPDKWMPPTNTENPTFGTDEFFEQRYGHLSGDQLKDAMEQGGWLQDAEGLAWYEAKIATQDLEYQDLFNTQFGAVEVDQSQPYTLGQTDDGTYYIAKTDETGEVSFKAISEDDYNKLYDEFYGKGGGVGSGDWSGVEDYLEGSGLSDGGTIVDGSNVILDENGYPVDAIDGEQVDDWITLQPGKEPTNAVPIDIKPVEEAPVDPEQVEDAVKDNGGGGGGGIDNNAVEGSDGTPNSPGASGPGSIFPPSKPNNPSTSGGSTPNTQPPTWVLGGGSGWTPTSKPNPDSNPNTNPNPSTGGSAPNTAAPPSNSTEGAGTSGSTGGTENGGEATGGGLDASGTGTGGPVGTGGGGTATGDGGGSGTVVHVLGGGNMPSGTPAHPGSGGGYGGGNGTGSGTGDGSGSGDGYGDGYGGGSGPLAGVGGDGRDRPVWYDLDPAVQFRARPRSTKITGKLFEDLMRDNLA